MSTYTEQDWLQTPPGRYLLAREQAFYDAAVADIFGFNALQLGLPGVDLLRECRIPLRSHCSPSAAAGVRCHFSELPFATHSADLLLLPHVLEYAGNPHDTLREAERVLVPEGHVILSGYNPISLWGARRLLERRRRYPWNGNFIPLLRIKDWLALLGLEVVAGKMGCYAPPCSNERWLSRWHFMDKAGDRWWPMLGGVYFLVAKKRVTGMRLIKPSWDRSRVARMLVPRPTQKTECQKQRHE